MDEKAQAALKGEKGALGSEDELQNLSDALSKEEGLAENTDINLYDGSQTPDDTPVESANDFNKQEALAGYHENGGNDVYLNIDKTDMTDSSDVVKSLVHEQERHSQAQNNSTLNDTDQTTLATNRGEQAQDTFNAYSDLAGIDTKSTTTQKNWNETNRSSENVVNATEQMKKMDSTEVKPLVPALVLAPEAAVLLKAGLVTIGVLGTGAVIDENKEEISNFVSDTLNTGKNETPIIEITPDEIHTGGDQIVDQENQPYATPVYDDPIDQLLENIPEGVENNSTALPAEDDLGLGLVLSENSYTPPPKIPEGFSDLTQVKPKTSVQGGGGLRKRWKDSKGNIYEWDSQHGAVEKYNKRGKHLGEFDPNTGQQTKPADKSRKVEP